MQATHQASATMTRPAEDPDEIPDLELSLPFFASDLPTLDQPLASTELVDQPTPQIVTETTLDTGRTEHPTVAQKAPHKIFDKQLLLKKRKKKRQRKQLLSQLQLP